MSSKYYQVLGVSSTASLGTIKKAYRSKAKILHPDVNKAPDAHDQFILLNEAYEYLENVKTGKVYRNVKSKSRTSKTTRKQQPKAKTYASEEEWQQAQRAKARARAQAYAKMKFEEYQQTDAYKTTNALGLLVGLLMDAFIVLLGIGIIATCLFALGSIAGAIAALVFIVVAGLLRKRTFIKFKNDLSNARAAIELLSETKIPLIIGLALLNIILMWTITLETLWIFSHLFFFYILLANMVVFLFWPTEKPEKQNEALWMIGYIPGAINFFFLLNFVFSSNTVIEYHKYKHLGWTIELDDQAYQEYRWLRLYPSFTEADDNNRIRFEFEEGIFGYTVLKDEEFYPN